MPGFYRLRRGLWQYKKIFISYLSMLLIALLFGIVLFIMVNIVISKQVEDTGLTAAEHFKSEAISLFREIEIITEAMAKDSIITRALRGVDQIAQNPINLCSEVSLYKMKNSFINNIYIISNKHYQILSSNGYYSSKSLYYVLSLIGETKESYTTVLTDGKNHGWYIGNNGTVAPYYRATVFSSDNHEKIAEIIVVTNMHSFNKMLRKANIAMCCLYNNEWYISSRGSGINDIDWNSDAEVSRLLDTNVKCFLTNTEMFTYLVAIPSRVYYASSYVIAYNFAAYFILTIIASLTQAIRASRRNFNRIAGIISHLPNRQKKIPSYEEIITEIEQSLVRYRNNDEHQHTVVMAHNLWYILSGSLKQAPSSQDLNNAGILPSCDSYYVVNFVVDDYSDLLINDINESENMDIVLTIFQSSLSNISKGNATVSCCDFGGSIAAVFSFNSVSTSYEAITSIIQENVTFLEQSYGLTISVAISSLFNIPDYLSEAYRQTCEIHNFAQAVNNDTYFISHKDLQSGGGLLLTGSYIKQIQIIVNTLLIGKYGIIPQLIQTLLINEVESLKANYTLAKSRIVSIAATLSEAVLVCGHTGIDLIEAANRLRSADTIASLISATTEVFNDLYLHTLTSAHTSAVDRACTYIRENIDDTNLSVPVVCDALEISVQHLSRLFQKQLGKTIAKYINEYRINYAKELLQNKKMTVSKIASTVGYYSMDTFYRNFKKTEGITPSEYRRQV